MANSTTNQNGHTNGAGAIKIPPLVPRTDERTAYCIRNVAESVDSALHEAYARLRKLSALMLTTAGRSAGSTSDEVYGLGATEIALQALTEIACVEDLLEAMVEEDIHDLETWAHGYELAADFYPARAFDEKQAQKSEVKP